jgi:GNAT superfamily N-acetyltransferase
MTFRMLPPEEWWKLKQLTPDEPDPRAGVFVLEDGETILAMRCVGQFVWVGGMVTHPTHRREGLATVLQHKVEGALAEVGMNGTYYMFPTPGEAEAAVESFGLEKLPLTLWKKEI